MIKIVAKKDKEDIVFLECSGHSGFAESGKDIVCSAVSTLVQNAILSLQKIANIPVKYVIDEAKAFLSIDIKNISNYDAQIIMKSTFLGLQALQKSYKKYIDIKGD